MSRNCCKNPADLTDGPSTRTASQRWARLAAWSIAVAVIWLIVLPGISRTPAVDRWIEFVEQQRVDPSAMFYTEVEGMPDTQQRIDRLRTQHAGSFWTVVPHVPLAEP